MARRAITFITMVLMAIALSGCASTQDQTTIATPDKGYSEIEEYLNNECVKYFVEGEWADDLQVLSHFEYLIDTESADDLQAFLDADDRMIENFGNLINIEIGDDASPKIIELHDGLIQGSTKLSSYLTTAMNASKDVLDDKYDSESYEYLSQMQQAVEDLDKGVSILLDATENYR